MTNFFGAHAAIHSTMWLNAGSLFSIAGLLKALAAGSPASLLWPHSAPDMDESLTHERRLFSAFMDNLPAFAWIKDLQGRYVYLNKLALKHLAPFQNEWLEKTDAELWPGEIGATYRANDLKVVASRETLETVETCVVEGEQHHLLVSKFPILDHAGAVTMVGGIGVDITGHQQAEKALREAEKKYRDIFENAVEGIFQTTPDGHFITANPALARILGYESTEELLSGCTDIARQHYVEPALRLEFKRMLDEDGVIRDFEHRAYRKDGHKIWLSENVRSVCDANGVVRYYEGFTEDITERKHAGESLGLFRNLIDQSNDAIEVLDPSTLRFLDCNTTAHQSLGYTREEFLSLSAFDIDPVIDPPIIERRNEEMAQAPFVIFESVHRRKDGSTFPVEINAKTIRLERDYLLAVVRDITERKRTEAALQESEERYRDLVENSRELICTHDLDGLILSANRAATEVLGHDREDYFGKKNLREILTPEALEGFEDYIARICSDGVASGIMLVQTSSGEERIWEYYNTLRTEGVAAPVVRGMARDITERRWAEEALRQSEREYRGLFENAHDAILIIKPEGEIVLEVNQRACEIYGYSRAEFIGMSLETISKNIEQGRLRIKETLECGTCYEFETIHRRGDGTEMFLRINASVVEYKGQRAIQSINRDVTDRKRAQELLQTFPRRLIDAQEEERKRIARELHDEIGQVLTAISLNLQAVRGLGLTPTLMPKIDESILVVEDALRHVQNLSLELRPSLLDDLGLAAAIRWFVHRYAQRTGIKVAVTMDVQMADGRLSRELETACFRIVQEALTNVARHAEAQTVSVHLRALSDEISISIKDDGVGFDASAGNGATPIRLGLRGMEERALALGGRLEIKSAPARGTEIWAHFPNEEKRTRP